MKILKLFKNTGLLIGACASLGSCILKPAQATTIKIIYSGSPNIGESELDFTLNTNVLDTNNSPTVGTFKNAIIDATYRCPQPNKSFCKGKPEINLIPATLNATFITTSITNLSDSFLGGIQYNATLKSTDNSVFYNIGIFVKLEPNLSIDILNNLSNLEDVIANGKATSIVGVGNPNNTTDPLVFNVAGLQAVDITNPTSVPEGNTTNSLLGAGAITVFFLIKKNKGLAIRKKSLIPGSSYSVF